MTVDIAQRAGALASQGRVQGALSLLDAAIRQGDAEATFTLASWRLAGTIVPRDLPLAQTLFDRAAALGHARAEAITIALEAHGAAGRRNWRQALHRLAVSEDADAHRELELLTAMDLTEDGDPRTHFPSERLHEAADIRLFRSALSVAECAFLIDQGLARFRPSTVVDPRTGKAIQNPLRTSDAASFPMIAESPAIHALNRRFAALGKTQPSQGEPLQLLRYAEGQQYRLHMDSLPSSIDNQRGWTILAYLNDGYEGGETHFPELGLSVRGNRGDVLLFPNLAADGTADERMHHAGLPVRRGTKYLASRWIRVRPLDLTGPARR